MMIYFIAAIAGIAGFLFGFDEGVAVEPLHLGPFGRDPLAVRVGRMTVAIRRSHARAVKVTTEDA